MRKAQKKQAGEFVKILGQAHDEIRNDIRQEKNDIAKELLVLCQDGAVKLGEMIEKTEEECFSSISHIESYCELIFQIYEKLVNMEDVNTEYVYDELQTALFQIQGSIETEIKVKLEIVFFPYKASMWDSLESIWMAADADPECDVYVVPIPYYNRNADGTVADFHYEGDDIPEYVPVTSYDSYDLQKRHPDVIYIHNPYDGGNFVTSVDPGYYSDELKKNTDLLVYVPYYTTSGGMSEAQSLCQAYFYVDYIIIQAEKYKKYFDPVIPEEKLVPLGSPKFDRVIRLCNNPQEPSLKWKEKMEGRKVYFYNTSINGMLADTERFLMKMEYVFKCFYGRKDACLLWRPHPLMESTFDSMRKEWRPFYDNLKQYFIQNNLGIYDDSTDIENTIALCDAYIGDSATSVTSLCGVAGKPLFILNNFIHTLPEPDDWRGEMVKGFFVDGQDEWMITQGNKLYHSPDNNYHFEYYCDLSEYAAGDYYLCALEIKGKIYVCPKNAQDILIVSNHQVVKKIALESYIERKGAFGNVWRIENYLFLIPYRYPAIVRYDIENDRVDYIKGYNDIFIKNEQGEDRTGGSCIWENYLLLASPVDNLVLAIESKTMEAKLLTTGAANKCGCLCMKTYEDGICILPYSGTTITCWNPTSGVMKEYSDMPKGFVCKDRRFGAPCTERPFALAAVYENQIILPPMWGNMFVSIDMKTGTAREWIPPFPVSWEERNCYFTSKSVGMFLGKTDTLGAGTFRFFYVVERKLYDINLQTMDYKEIELVFDKEELLRHEPGFGRNSDWLKYGCDEKALYTLRDFLDGTNKGQPFDREKQIQAFGEITANIDGTSGRKIHQFVCAKV